MDFLAKIVAAMLGRVLADELKAWCPSITEFLVKLAVRRLPEQMRERYAEEWRAHIAEVPGEVGKVFCAFGFVCAGWRIWEAIRIQRLRDFIERFPGQIHFISRVMLLASLFVSSFVVKTFSGASIGAFIFVFGVLLLYSYVFVNMIMEFNLWKKNKLKGR